MPPSKLIVTNNCPPKVVFLLGGTHVINLQSRRAIERLGARLDGILRAHMIMKNGTIRDTAVYSITAAEWPTVRAHLEFQAQRNGPVTD